MNVWVLKKDAVTFQPDLTESKFKSSKATQ